MTEKGKRIVTPVSFDRTFNHSDARFMTIGSGRIGGKASGLLRADGMVAANRFESGDDRLLIEVERSVVVTTAVFDAFMERNGLYDIALSGEPDERIALAFHAASLPAEFVGDLMSLVSLTAGNPLAVRSSSLLEDSLAHPFAGIYQTKMIPNNQPDSAGRFRALADALKFVYASVFSHAAISYVRAVGRDPREEKMAVLVHEIVGRRFDTRFYPEVSGICRSYSYYRTGSARPDEGVVTLALGLGKTIMDGGVSYSYSPAHPRARPPFSSVREQVDRSQLRFWAVNLGKPPAYDPIRETEFLIECHLDHAEDDGSLTHIASTYDVQNDRLTPGTGNHGPRVIDFAPTVRMGLWPVTEACKHLLDVFRREMGYAVEVEFAVTYPADGRGPARMTVLQVRPMAAPGKKIDVAQPATDEGDVLVYSDLVMGNGSYEDVTDIVYVKPDSFERSQTRQIGFEIEAINEKARADGRRYLLIGFGRWGSSDPWLGIPVTWGQISSAAAIVESTLPDMNVEPSQGAHFFLNIESFRVAYFTVPHSHGHPVDWSWFMGQAVVEETEHVRHVRAEQPMRIMVDGRTGRGVVRRAPTDSEVETGQSR